MKLVLPAALALSSIVPCIAATGEEILGVDPDFSERTGLYVAGFGGLTFAPDPNAGFDSVDFDFDLDDAAHFGGAIGFALGRVRAEAEVSYWDTEGTVDDIASTVFGLPENDVEYSSLNVMANLYYDQPIVEGIDLYLGAGVGAAFVDLDLDRTSRSTLTITRTGGANAGVSENTIVTDGGSDVTISAQVLAGLAWRINERIALTGGYRGVFTSEADPGDYPVDGFYRSAIEAGLRISF